MIDWEKIIEAESDKELKEAKLWLFKEQMRLEKERTQLEEIKEKFNSERASFREEMNILNRKSVMERKRLKDENLFFDKKMEILKDGFRKLEEDRKDFERQKRDFEIERQVQRRKDEYYAKDNGFSVDILFRNATNPLALRKRYKDLIKIYHPDNFAGDEELVQQINKEYAKRRREEA